MAFTVPVLKKDYLLYSHPKKPVNNVRKPRADSNPESVKKFTARPSRLSCSVDFPPQSSTPSSTNSTPTKPHRGNSRRISILPLTPEEQEPISPNHSRQVRFGVCEEIQYDELENDVFFEAEISPSPNLTKPKSCLRSTDKKPSDGNVNHTDLIANNSPKRVVLRLLSLCTPKN